MSIDFTGITGVSDDYGVVTQIADASGRVIWSAVKNAVVTISTYYGPKASIIINGEAINLNVTSVNRTFECPVGSTIYFTNTSKAKGDVNIKDTTGAIQTNYIRSNGGTFAYTVTGNTIITASATSRDYGPSMYEPNTPVFTVEEVLERPVFVNITGTGYYSGCYVSIDGSKLYYTQTLAVPVGTVIYCYAISNDGADSGYYGLISVNGTLVATAKDVGRDCYAEYNYTVNGNVTIWLSGGSSSDGGGTIEITET